MSQEALAKEIQSLMSEKLLVEVESPDTDLLKAGILDSLKVVQLLLHLERHFGLTLSIDELEIEDLRTVSSIALTIVRQSVTARVGKIRHGTRANSISSRKGHQHSHSTLHRRVHRVRQ